MRTMLVAGLLAGFAGLAQAEDKKADPVGTWKCGYEIGDQKRTAEVTIRRTATRTPEP